MIPRYMRLPASLRRWPEVNTLQRTDFRTVPAEPGPATIEAWLMAWMDPEAEAMSATGSRRLAVSDPVRRNRSCVAAAQLLRRIADLLVTPVVDSPSSCRRNEFLVPYSPGALFCSRDSRLHPERGLS